MNHEAIADVRTSPRMSIRRLLGLHEHVFSTWAPRWATPAADGRMELLQVRECAVCHLAEFRSETRDVPATGFPHDLHTQTGTRPRD